MWYKTVVEIFSFMWTGILPATSYPWTRSSYVPVGVPVVLMALFFCCEHMKYSAEEGVLLCHAHRASVTKKLLKYPGFIMLHYNIYIYIYIYIWMENLFGTVFLMDGKRTKRHDCGWNEISMKYAELEATLKQSFLFSSTQCNVSESSVYTATNLLNIMIYNTSFIVMQSCETLLCAILVINSWKTANIMHKNATHHSPRY